MILPLETLEDKIWARMRTATRRAIQKKYKKWGHRHYYRPRRDLVERISEELNEDYITVYKGIINIRESYMK